jgi:hypothetical protein
MSDDKLAEIEARHAAQLGSVLDIHGHDDIAWLIAEVKRLRAPCHCEDCSSCVCLSETYPKRLRGDDEGCPHTEDGRGPHWFKRGDVCDDCGYVRRR